MATKFKVGEMVTVTRAAKSYEKNWNDSWVDGMNSTVGRTYRVEVVKADKCGGIRLSAGYWYPSFVLRNNLNSSERSFALSETIVAVVRNKKITVYREGTPLNKGTTLLRNLVKSLLDIQKMDYQQNLTGFLTIGCQRISLAKIWQIVNFVQ